MLDNLVEYGFISLILAAIAFGVFKAVKLRYTLYHVYKRNLKKQKELAEKMNNIPALQQVRLEEKWLERVEDTYRHSNFRLSSVNQRQAEIDSELAEIYSGISAEELRLPSEHNQHALSSHNVETFMWSIVYETDEVIANSTYEDAPFLPSFILPYPKDYVLYALRYAIKHCPRSKEVALRRMLERLTTIE